MNISKYWFVVFLVAVVIGCSSSFTSNLSDKKNLLDLKGKTFIYYFDGEPLNILSFGDSTFTYQSGEMETIECGKYFQAGEYWFIMNQRVIWPSGLEEIDSVRFVLKTVNDSTLTYIKRVEFGKHSRQWDTTKLNPTYYSLKKGYQSEILPCPE